MGAKSVVGVCIAASIAGALTASCRSLAMRPTRDFSVTTNLDEAQDMTANVSLGDLDGDGDLDIVLAKGRHWGDVDLIVLNDGHGKFTTKPLAPVEDSSYSALLADVDGDGDLDVIVSNDSEPGRVYLNDGKANFYLGGEWGNALWPTRNATVADLNRDGHPDIIAANRSARDGMRSQVCLNDGRGHFTVCTELVVGPATTIVAADFDRDGHIDLAAPHRDGGQSLVLYNDGRAGFTRTAPFGPITTAARTAVAADLNGDGWPDVVVGDEYVGAFVYFGDGHGGLGPGRQLTFDRLGSPYSMAVGDLNHDGHVDIVIGYHDDRGSVLFNDGTGRSFRHVRFGDAEAAVYGVALGDLNADGYPDIVTARNEASNVVFFSRAGTGVDTVLASDHPESPSRRLRPPDPDTARFGTWHGVSSRSGNHWDVEIRLTSLEPGKYAGVEYQSSNGVSYCATSLTLAEQKPDGVFRFSTRGRDAGCVQVDGEAEARWLDADHVQWEHWWPERPRSRATATLERRRVKPAVALFEAGQRSPSDPTLGVWRGEVKNEEDDDSFGVEVRLDQLVKGASAGSLLHFSTMPSGHGDNVWCTGVLITVDRKDDAAVVLKSQACPTGSTSWIRATLKGERLQLEWFSSGALDDTPWATATLQRKEKAGGRSPVATWLSGWSRWR